MQKVIINHKKYTVERVFNMVANYYFTDKNGIAHLVDAEDVAEWLGEQGLKFKDGMAAAIAYAKYYARETEDGCFWWKRKVLG